MTRPPARPRAVALRRPCLLAGALLLAAASAGWAAARLLGLGTAGTPAVVLHALSMVFGPFPMFFAAFAFGTGAKWLRAAPPGRTPVAALAALHAGGWLLVAAGEGSAVPVVAHVGLAAVALAAWAACALHLMLLRASRRPDGLHARLIALAALAGALLATAAAAAFVAGDVAAVLAACRAAVWAYVGTTFLAAAHRMVPFVSGTPFRRLDARWPDLPLHLIAVGLVAAALAELGAVPLPASQALRGAIGVVLAACALRWPFVHPLRAPLLRMLHAGFAWLAASFVLAGLGAIVPVGSLPLHAFALGFLGSTMFALLSRMIAAQSGAAETVDRTAWRLFVALQFAAVLRIAGPPAGLPAAIEAAAALWSLAWIAWAARTVLRTALGRRPPR